MSNINGKWILKSNENMDDLMKEIGVGSVLRKLGSKLNLTLVINSVGKKWTIQAKSSLLNFDEEFNLGEEFDLNTPDGRKVKCLYYLDGVTLVCEQRNRKTNELDLVARISIDQDGNMIQILTSRGVTGKRIFKRA